MEELDVQAVLGQPRELRDPVAPLEAEDKPVAGVVRGFELIEPKEEPRRLLAESDLL